MVRRRQGANVLGFEQEKRSKIDKDDLIHLVEPDDLVSYGMIPELIGRLHVFATLEKITQEDMVRILTEPKNALVKQYKQLFELDNVILTFEKEALDSIKKQLIEKQGLEDFAQFRRIIIRKYV